MHMQKQRGISHHWTSGCCPRIFLFLVWLEVKVDNAFLPYLNMFTPTSSDLSIWIIDDFCGPWNCLKLRRSVVLALPVAMRKRVRTLFVQISWLYALVLCRSSLYTTKIEYKKNARSMRAEASEHPTASLHSNVPQSVSKILDHIALTLSHFR